MSKVLIPRDAVGDVGDVAKPTTELLRELSLLPTAAEMAKVKPLSGTPDSVAVIEAGLTAGSKIWAVAIGGSSTALTAAAIPLWNQVQAPNQPFLLIGLALVVAAGSLGIAYILGSDVRGRAAASTATIEARSSVAVAMLTQARQAREAPPSTTTKAESSKSKNSPVDKLEFTYFPVHLTTTVKVLEGADSTGWLILAGRMNHDAIQYHVVKASEKKWVNDGDIEFP